MSLILDADQFFHQRVVDMQATRSVDQERIETCLLRVFLSLAHQC